MSTRVVSRWPLLEAVDRHDGEQLAQGPVIEQRLEHGEIAEVLVAQAVLQLPDLLRDVRLSLEAADHGLADLPVQRLDLGFVLQLHEAEDEHIMGILPPFGGVVKRLQLIQLVEVATHVEQFADQRMLVVPKGQCVRQPGLVDGTEDLDHQTLW
jgi:hypothetical protein